METIAVSSMEQQCMEMGATLGLNEPVSEAVLKAALADSTYANHLLVCRGAPQFLAHLLANPPEIAATESLSTTTLLVNAGESLARWVKTGFSTVSEDTYRNRLQLCSACPNLTAPPEHQRTLYAIAGAAADERSVCSKCGCVASVKARRPSDTCPEPHPDRPGFNRWNEPIPQGG
ncbi:hypothetical protein SAMN05216315_11240 [Nitrosospira sp. Nsp18]|uniref:hypothetical protein n=1 Tax=Nitrosospira sp. Nsp18 TaxID=1855334 RepID=UPI00087F861E|nr:hypothetical protein [Nitrosospira sp. Nsp18]SDA19779.1 hypothetical protein SAMN05216315_11240 [Nitrosospira sp. Nsp18]